ncbi:F-box/FBD/LRR-repeat protein-like protein [Salvia divinorum]|uniref:F-box/FBD/LRR-repeat protein-like protein n=1 Tax=Salvia divinorum TaxID=28513 RepID=A0ABD1HMY8_SALDI
MQSSKQPSSPSPSDGRTSGAPSPISASSAATPEFVSQLLSRRDPSAAVDDFHFPHDSVFPPEFVEECVAYAVSHGVKSLRLRAPTAGTLRLPVALFASATLRELELRQLGKGIYLPRQFSLPNLKTLYLESELCFDNDCDPLRPWSRLDVEREPFAGLPELERLTLRGHPIPRLVIKAPKLRVLEIFFYNGVEEISAPLLTSFTCHSSSPWKGSKMNLPMLEEVYLDICDTTFNAIGLHQNFVRMLHQLGNATTVTLTLDTLKVLALDGGPVEKSPSPFPNIKCLKVVKKEYHEIYTVFKGVMNYLNFESLMVELPDGVDVVEHNDHGIEYCWSWSALG